MNKLAAILSFLSLSAPPALRPCKALTIEPKPQVERDKDKDKRKKLKVNRKKRGY